MVALCAVMMAVLAAGMFKALTRVQVKADGISDRLDPILVTLRKFADENAPKVSSIASNAEVVAANARDISVEARQISHVAREQAHRFAVVGDDIAVRTLAKAAQVDALMDDAVAQAQIAGVQVKEAMLKPVREASGVAAGIRAAVTTYAAANRRGTLGPVAQDEEMFI